MANIIVQGTFTGTDRNPNTKGSGRLLTISRDAAGIRVRVVGDPFLANDPMVIISDEVVNLDFANLILRSLPADLRVSKGSAAGVVLTPDFNPSAQEDL